MRTVATLICSVLLGFLWAMTVPAVQPVGAQTTKPLAKKHCRTEMQPGSRRPRRICK